MWMTWDLSRNHDLDVHLEAIFVDSYGGSSHGLVNHHHNSSTIYTNSLQCVSMAAATSTHADICVVPMAGPVMSSHSLVHAGVFLPGVQVDQRYTTGREQVPQTSIMAICYHISKQYCTPYCSCRRRHDSLVVQGLANRRYTA